MSEETEFRHGRLPLDVNHDSGDDFENEENKINAAANNENGNEENEENEENTNEENEGIEEYLVRANNVITLMENVGIATASSSIVNNGAFTSYIPPPPSLFRSICEYKIPVESKTDKVTPTGVERIFSQSQCKIDDNGNITINTSISPELYKCSVCQEFVVENAGYCTNMHCTCQSCHNEMKQHATAKCPICRDVTYKKDYFITNIVKKMRVPCPNHENGCIKLLFPSEKDDHLEECKFKECKCPICQTKTNPANLHAHLMTACEKKFEVHNVTNYIDYIASEKVNNVIIEAESGRLFIVIKDATSCKMLCIDCHSIDNKYIQLRFNVKNEKSSIKELIQLEIPIYGTDILIREEIEYYTISLSKLRNIYNIQLFAFSDKYCVNNTLWNVRDKYNDWYTARIVKRSYIPNRIKVNFVCYSEEKYDEWIDLDSEQDRIQPIKHENNSTSERIQNNVDLYNILNMNEEDQLQAVLNMSMDNQ